MLCAVFGRVLWPGKGACADSNGTGVGFGSGFAGLGAEVSGPEDVGDGVLKPGVLPDIPAAPEHFGGSGLLCGAGSGRDGCAGGSGVRRELCADVGGDHVVRVVPGVRALVGVRG